MLKIDTFLIVANFFSGKIYRGSFTNQNGFSALLKKITEMRDFWIGCMNYIFGKTFKKILKILNFGVPAHFSWESSIFFEKIRKQHFY